MAQRLTDAIVKRLPPPEKNNKVYYDTDVKGFGARVTAAGARSFVLTYRTRAGRERRYTIGSCTDWATTAARAKARELRRNIDDGGDPLADIEAEREAPTVWELCERFEQEHLSRKRPATADDYRRILRMHVRPFFGPHAKVQDVAFADVDRLHRKVTAAGHPRRANAVVAVLSKMFNLAVRWGMRADNPCKGVERNYETKRKRYMSSDELARLTKALAEHPDRQAADVVRVCLLTGCRRGEALAMQWGDVDLTADTWSKPGTNTKQKADHVVPLSAPARQLLARSARSTPARTRSGRCPNTSSPAAAPAGT
jgi:integrase